MATTASSRASSRHASMSSFSRNGLPTWTAGRRSSRSSPSVAEANEAPWIPSRPVDGADEQEHVAGARGARQRDLVVPRDADAHRVHQRVAGVRRVERDLAADVGNADAVAVAGDAADHAAEQVAVAGRGGRIGLGVGLERAEAQRVEQRDRPRAHGEDVADDAADPGRRPLVRLHRGRVVVRLDLEDDRQAVADVDRARRSRPARRAPRPPLTAGDRAAAGSACRRSAPTTSRRTCPARPRSARGRARRRRARTPPRSARGAARPAGARASSGQALRATQRLVAAELEEDRADGGRGGAQEEEQLARRRRRRSRAGRARCRTRRARPTSVIRRRCGMAGMLADRKTEAAMPISSHQQEQVDRAPKPSNRPMSAPSAARRRRRR